MRVLPKKCFHARVFCANRVRLASRICFNDNFRGKLHTTACYFRRNWVISSLREALRARYSEKWELENLLVNLEFDSFQLSGECVTILHEPMRTPVQTFCV